MQKIAQVKLSDEYIVDMHKVLGKGSTGSVYEGRNVKNNEKVAVKVIELSKIDNEVTQYLLKMEKTALMMLQSPHILKGLRIMQDKKFCFLVTEFCNGGTLKKYIKDNGCLSEQKSLEIIKSILLGYSNLVEKRIVHRDLKPANIMMNNEIPKIIDFGYCEVAGYQKPSLEYNVGSPSYMSPQAYELNIYNEKSQIWAIGMILYECIVGKTIDEGRKMSDTYQAMQEFGIALPDYISQKTRDIINSCLSMSPRKRPTCSQLLSKYFSEKKPQTLVRSKSTFCEEVKRESHKLHDFIEKQDFCQKRNSILTPFTPIENINLLNITPKEVLRAEKIPKESVTQRGNFGVLTNHHQQILRNYVQNRTKVSFSNYEAVKSFVKQPQHLGVKQVKQLKHSPSFSTHNDYGLFQKNFTKNMQNVKYINAIPSKGFNKTINIVNAKVQLNTTQQKVRPGQFKFHTPMTPLNGIKVNGNVLFHSRTPSHLQRERAISFRI